MRIVIFLLLLTLTASLSAHPAQKRDTPVKVKQILGNPNKRITYQNTQIWYYYFIINS